MQLHVIDRPKLAEHLESNRKRFDVVDARRGDILDRRGHLLATTRSLRDVGVDPHMLRDEDRHKWPELASLLEMDLQELTEKLEYRYRNVGETYALETVPVRWNVLRKGVEEDTYQKLMNLHIRGVYGNRTYERTYPHDRLAAHLVGFLNREESPVQGVEQWMDFFLRGQDGWRESERDGRRRELAQFRTREVAPMNGLNVELTIDLVVQHVIEEEIELLVKEWSPKGVTIIVSDPTTGDVLGMGSYPTFNPNRFWEEPIEHHRNRAITDVYEPGSTFKIVVLSASLNEGVVTPDTQFDCSLTQGQYNGRLVRLPKNVGTRSYEMTSVREIAMKSLNNGSALMAMRLGGHKLYEYAQAFGFGEVSGFPQRGEVRGTLHPVKNWDGLTISRLPIGHAVSSTPLQTHYAMSVLANGGVLMKPRLVKRIADQNGEDFLRLEPEVRRRVISEKTARTMASMLVEAVGPEGTGGRAAIRGFEVAGKTGTTQKIVDGRYSSQHHVASFVGFFPASNPKLVISVIVDEPRGGVTGYGGVVSAPSFRRIAEPLIQYLRIAPAEIPAEWMALKGEY